MFSRSRGRSVSNRDFFFSSRRRHTGWTGDWSSDVCSSDLGEGVIHALVVRGVADVAYSAGDYALAQQRATEALDLARAAGELRTASQALRVLGMVSFQQGNYAKEIGRASCRERVYIGVGAG